MAVKIALNGFGRIGRYLARIVAGNEDVQLVCVNARGDNASLAYLLKYDSVHGTFAGDVEPNEQGFLLNGKQVLVTRNAPDAWDWKGIDILIESTGKFNDRLNCEKHLEAGAKKVLISAPCKDADLTVVMGVNDGLYNPSEHKILSNASCTTNCLAPAAKALNDTFGIKHGLMTTIHSYTMGQRMLDGTHKDIRRGRAGAINILPTTTGAAKAVSLVIPALAGKLDGMAVRVPTPNVSLVDLVVEVEKPTTVAEVNAVLKAAASGPEGGAMDYTEVPLVSTDYIGSIYGGVVDGLCTSVMNGTMVKIIVWYDNEAGFTNQLLRLAKMVGAKL
ncbi:MAG: type I glyceraldehyde-3-phosphate dehydrogenase [Desulfomicrobium sp.]|nr:type I glyceraldehyde-3-phosphate dehydrogenase [Desulfomicrobium sp.]